MHQTPGKLLNTSLVKTEEIRWYKIYTDESSSLYALYKRHTCFFSHCLTWNQTKPFWFRSIRIIKIISIWYAHFISKMCISTQEQKQKPLWRCWVKLVSVSLLGVNQVLYCHGVKLDFLAIMMVHWFIWKRKGGACKNENTIPKPWSQTYWKCKGRAEKACASKADYKLSSVTPVVSIPANYN